MPTEVLTDDDIIASELRTVHVDCRSGRLEPAILSDNSRSSQIHAWSPEQ